MVDKLGNKSGGRKKGSKNRIDNEIREEFAIFLRYASPKIQGLWEQLIDENPKEALNVIKDYAEFVLPKLARTDIQHLDEDGNKANASLEVRIIESINK